MSGFTTARASGSISETSSRNALYSLRLLQWNETSTLNDAAASCHVTTVEPLLLSALVLEENRRAEDVTGLQCLGKVCFRMQVRSPDERSTARAADDARDLPVSPRVSVRRLKKT